jgi:hypothetical protein
MITGARRTVVMLSADGGVRLRYIKLCHATGVTLGLGLSGRARKPAPSRQNQSTLARVVSW